mgnify:CR=1 FL=1
MKRRISAILLVIALLVSLIPTVVIAADTFKLNPVASVESVSVENPIAKGKTVTITLNYVNWPEKVDTLQIDMTYDQTKFSCKPAGVKVGSVPADPYTEEAPSFTKNAANGKVSAGYAYYIAGEATASGTIMTVTFTALEDITSSCEFGIVVKTLVIGGVSSTDALETPEKLTIAGGVTPPAHTHDLKKVPAKDATCTEAGNKEYWECKTCGNFYWDADGKNEITNKNDVIVEAGHKYGDLIAEVSATCGKDGVKAHYECSVCHKNFDTNFDELTDLVIPATGNHIWELVEKEVEDATTHTKKCKVCGMTEEETHDKWPGDYPIEWTSNDDYHWHQFACGTIMNKAAHTWNAGVVTKEATCTEPGEKTFTCDVCHATKTEPINATGHKYEWKHDETNHWQECSVCGNTIDKAEHTYAAHKCEDPATCTKAECGYVKPAGQHSWDEGKVTVPATCTTDGVKTFTCKVCSETKTEPIKASGHTVVEDAAKEPTCTETGLTAGKHCSVCNEVLEAQTVVPAKGHKMTKTEAKAATCTEAGNNAYWTCETCGQMFKDEQGTQPTNVAAETIKALDHDFTGAWVNTDAAGHYHKCTRCDATDTVIKHTFNGKPCNEEDKCNDCGYVKLAGQHTWGEKTYKWNEIFKCTATTACTSCNQGLQVIVDGVKTTVPATCVADGKDVYTATFTDAAFTTQTKEVTIEKLGHTYGAPVWSWSEDGKTATATFTCTREGCTAETTGHAQNVTATVSGKQKVAPTCTDKGTTTYTAKVTFEKKDYADTKDVQDIKALGHKLTKTAAKAATCTEAGNSEYYTCGTCGKFFSDKDGKTEIAKDSWVINALGHKMTETPAVTPTCAAGGNNEYWTCSVCHKVFKADKTTETTVAKETLAKDPANHTGGEEQRGAVAASCMTAGRTDDTYCKGCGKLTKAGDLIPPTGEHNYKDGVCTTCGSKQPADNATIKAAIEKVVADAKEAVEEVLDKAIKNETDANTKKILEKLKGYVSGSSRSKLQAVYNVTMSLNGQDLDKGDSLADGQNVTIAISEETYNALRSGAKIVESYLDKDGNAQTREINATLKKVGDGYTVTFAADKTAAYGLMTRTSSGGSGSGSSYTSGQSFTTDLPADSINRVTVNGKKLDSKYYTVSSNGSGSIVTLTDAYLATLKAGKYTVKIENKTHVSTGAFTIKADGTLSSPKTADAGIALYAMLAVSSLMGTAVVSKKRRKA